MAVVLAPIGVGFQFFGGNTPASAANQPLVGGLLNVYAAGTTTPVTTYTSSSGLIANTNPIVLDASGRVPFEIWWTAGSSYKFVLQDSAGNTIPNGTWDNVPGINDPSVLFPVSAGSVTFTPPGTGGTARTVQTKLAEIQLSIIDYGADPTNTTDSTSAINSCIAEIVSLGGGTVYFPQGTYKVSSTILITNSNIKLIGAGIGSFHYIGTTVTAASSINWIGGATPIIQFDPSYPTNNQWLSDCQLDGIFLKGHGLATVGVQINSCRNGRFRVFGIDCTVNLCQTGCTLPGTPLSDTSDCQQNYIEVQGNQTQANAPNGGLLKLDGQLFTFQGYANASTTLNVTSIAAPNYIPIGATLLIGSGTSATNSGVTIASYGTGNGANTGTYILSGSLTTAGAPTPVTLSISNANSSDNIIGYVDGNTYNGNSVTWANCDNNLMHHCRTYSSGPGTAGFSGTGRSMVFQAGGYNMSARENYVTHLSPASVNALNMIVAQGTESGAQNSFGNYITYLDPIEGGNAQPAFGTTATLFYNLSNGVFPAVRATTQNNTAQTINSSTPVTIAWDNVSGNYDLQSNFASNTFTAPKWGVYDVSVTLTNTTTMVAGDRYQLDIVVVGAFGATASTQCVAVGTGPQAFLARAKMRMQAGDTLTVQLSRQSGTGSFVPSASSTNNRLEITYCSQAT